MTKAELKRHAQIMDAARDERTRVNIAIDNGKIATVKTFCGLYILDGVTDNFDYITHPQGQTKQWLNQRTWAGCNDSTWLDILNQLNVSRNPLFNH